LEEKIKLLIGLQECDTKIQEIEKKKTECPLRIKRLADRLNEMEKEWQGEEKALETFKTTKRGVDVDIEAIESKLDKANIKLSNIKSNKEYRAALKEIEDSKHAKSRLEDQAIELMEQIDLLSNQSREKREQKGRLEEEVAVQKEEILREIEKMDISLKKLVQERDAFCKKVDGGLLKQYDFIRSHRAGLAISPVTVGVCQTCHMGIPPQKFNELIRGDSLQTCPSCNRIIYWADNVKFQKAGEEE
jgi:predicted  nucleic acid-binding Zn-ribbon protein